MPLVLWLRSDFLLALKYIIPLISGHASKSGITELWKRWERRLDTKRMGHSMQKLCPLPGTIQTHQLLEQGGGKWK